MTTIEVNGPGGATGSGEVGSGETGSGRPFAALLSPGRIAGLVIPNRVLLPAMDMNLCHEGEITDPEIAHYRARAAGGTGMVITGTGAAWVSAKVICLPSCSAARSCSRWPVRFSRVLKPCSATLRT